MGLFRRMAGAGGGSGNHSDPGIAPFFSMSNSGLSTSLHQMASGDYRQLDISKVQVLRTSPQRELVGLLPLSNGWVESRGRSWEEHSPQHNMDPEWGGLHQHGLPSSGEVIQTEKPSRASALEAGDIQGDCGRREGLSPGVSMGNGSACTAAWVPRGRALHLPLIEGPLPLGKKTARPGYQWAGIWMCV